MQTNKALAEFLAKFDSIVAKFPPTITACGFEVAGSFGDQVIVYRDLETGKCAGTSGPTNVDHLETAQRDRVVRFYD